MRIRRKFKGGGTKDNKGYLEGNRDNFTPYKEIEGGDITMDGVDMPLVAIPMDENGDFIGMKFMKPGKEYDFKNADSTLEIPIYKKGDKAAWIKKEIKRLEGLGQDRNDAIKTANAKYEDSIYGATEEEEVESPELKEGGQAKWVSKKIGILINEGYPKDQAAAIAYSMYKKDHKMDGGEMEFMQGAGQVGRGQFSWDRQMFSEKDMVDRLKSGQIQVPGMRRDPQLPDNLRIGPSDTAAEPNQAATTQGDFRFYDEENLPTGLDYQLPDNIREGTTGFEPNNTEVNTSPEASSTFTGNIPTEEELMEIEAELDLADQQEFVKELEKQEAADKIKKTTKTDIKNPFKFFNPSQGVDISTAANLFGQNIGKGGNAATAIGAGAKMLLGLGRNITSGIGAANANQFGTEEYNQKNREYQKGKAPVQYEQDGGQLNTIEKDEARAGLGVNFNDDTMDALFEKVGPVSKPQSYEPNLGKYRGMDYFNKVKVDGNSIKLATGKKYPSNSENLNPYIDYLRKQNPGYDVDVQYKEAGGKVTPEVMSTGNFSVETGGMHNVEVEVNEYLLDPDGNLTKVLGEPHEKGGVKMELPEGTKIVSDHLKLKSNAKKISKDFDLNLSAKDTYAKAIDKFYQKSGLQELIDEEAQIAKTIKEQKIAAAEVGGDNATRNINLEFLSSKINELNEAKQPMLDAARIFFSKIYDTQEKAKPKKEQESEFEDGGSTEPNDAVNEGFFKDMLSSLRGAGYNGTDDIKEMQDWAVANKPDVVLDYFKNGPATYTSKGISSIQKENPEIFKAAGIPIKENPGEYTEEERAKIKAAYQDKGLETDDFLLSQFADGLKAYRSPLLPSETLVKSVTNGGVELLAEMMNKLPSEIKEKVTAGKPLTAEEEKVVTDLSNSKKANTGVYLQPDQELLPPTGMVPATKIERQYGQMEAELFTPDAQLNELNRSVDAAMNQLKDLPSGQQEAAIVKLQANKQQQADRIVSTVEAQNKQLRQQEQAFNIRQADRGVDANATDNLSFEQRSQGAMANTEDDFRRYFNEGQRRNVENFKTIESLNLINQLNENFDFTGNGVENTVGTGITDKDLMNMMRFQLAVNSGDVSVDKKEKAQNGGEAKRARRVSSSADSKKDTRVTRLYRRKGSKIKKALNFQTPDSTGLA